MKRVHLGLWEDVVQRVKMEPEVPLDQLGLRVLKECQALLV